MTDDLQGHPWSPEGFRPYLLLLTRQSMGRQLRTKCDSSDLVQQTLLQAHQNIGQFRGKSEGEFKAWLRRILANSLKNKLAELGSQKRDVARERSLEASLEDTSARLEEWLVSAQASPSDLAIRREQWQQLQEILAHLPEDQREALELRHLQGCSVAEICRQMGRTEAAVAGLIRRGMKKLREHLGAGS